MFSSGKIPQKSVFNEGFVKPELFYPKNREQNGTTWDTVENVIIHEHDKKNKSQSRVTLLYPKFPGRPEFCHEEFMAYKWFSKNKNHPQANEFVQKYDEFWKDLVVENENSQSSTLCSSMDDLNLMQKKQKSKSPRFLIPQNVTEKVAFRTGSPNSSPMLSAMKPMAKIRPNIKSRSPLSSIQNTMHSVRSSPCVMSPRCPIINPFAKEFKEKMVSKTDISDRLKNISSCTIKYKSKTLSKGQTLDFGSEQFYVIKSLIKGGYGTIYTAKAKSTGAIYALKQEKPPNLWEFHVCLELQERIRNQEILPAFITITHGLLTNEHSILATNYAPFGSLIEVCNKVRHKTNRVCEEIIVVSAAHQILQIFKFLHEAEIIHADVKPDNFLVIREVGSHPFIQLMDFGCSIDMKLVKDEYPNFDGFRAVCKKDQIVEMLENRPWSYQIDYFGIAGTIHVMLLGEHMKIMKDGSIWKSKTALKRYMNQNLWEKFFRELLNIRVQKPDVEEMIKNLDQELKLKQSHEKNKFIEFNNILKSK